MWQLAVHPFFADARPDYMGPEAVEAISEHRATFLDLWQVYKKAPYGKECDMWSLGIIMFEVGVGVPLK